WPRLRALRWSKAGAPRPGGDAVWVLRGVTSNERYITRSEHSELAARQEPLGRAGSTRAALIPIGKSEAWWDLAQDERRRIVEEAPITSPPVWNPSRQSRGGCTTAATSQSPSTS